MIIPGGKQGKLTMKRLFKWKFKRCCICDVSLRRIVSLHPKNNKKKKMDLRAGGSFQSCFLADSPT